MGDEPDESAPAKRFSFEMVDYREDGEIQEHGYYERRRGIYAELAKRTGLPEVIRAVERFAPCTPVEWIENDPAPSSTDHEGHASNPWKPITRPGTYINRSLEVKLENEINGIQREDPPEFPETAGEALASELRFVLASLRKAEKAQRKGRSSRSPVRGAGMLPRSLLSEVAVDLPRDCKDGQYPPGYELICLVRELLDVDRVNRASSREYVARHLAVNLVAAGDFGVRELASLVRVSPGTVSHWLRDPRFKDDVERARRSSEHHFERRRPPPNPGGDRNDP